MATTIRNILAIACILAYRTCPCRGGEPSFQSTSLVLTDSLPQVVTAVTNAFGNGAYHDKRLVEYSYEFVVTGEKRIAVPRTNTWNLERGALPLTLLPRGKKMVAYDEGFEIKVEALDRARTKVSVTPTESATTEDWYAVSSHLAPVLGEKYQPPLAPETSNLFWRLRAQLEGIQAGRTNPLPATPDTRPGFYKDFWETMDARAKHDSHNWEKMVQTWKGLQAEAKTNSSNSLTNNIR